MKTKVLIPFLAFMLVLTALNAQTPDLSRKPLITLRPGEEILYGESSINISVTNSQLYLVTMLDEKIYVYENGQRKGPFDDTEEANIKKFPSTNDNRCSLFETEPTPFDHQIVTTNQDGSFSIKLNNKTYGPYPFIAQLHVRPDKSGFVAISMDKEMKSYLISSEGVNMPLKGTVERIHFSPNGKKYIFALKETQEIDMSLLNMDFSKMTQEEIMEFAKKQEEKAKNAPALHSYIYVNGTTKLGPYELNAFYSSNPAFTKTGGENWIMTLGETLYINGVKVKDYPDIDLNTCRIWLSADGKKYVIISYDKIIFSDGKAYDNPIEPNTAEKNGVINVSWVSLENEKDLVLYSRAL